PSGAGWAPGRARAVREPVGALRRDPRSPGAPEDRLIATMDRTSRIEQQRRYFFEPLLALTGGSLGGRRVLDVGCGEGEWSLRALEAGASFVLALDPSATAVEAGRRRLEQAGVEPSRARVEQAEVPGSPVEGGFDVALCIGLMERTGRPVELFELFASVGAELVLIDTEVSG